MNEKLFLGLKYPERVSFNFEIKITGCSHYCRCDNSWRTSWRSRSFRWTASAMSGTWCGGLSAPPTSTTLARWKESENTRTLGPECRATCTLHPHCTVLDIPRITSCTTRLCTRTKSTCRTWRRSNQSGSLKWGPCSSPSRWARTGSYIEWYLNIYVCIYCIYVYIVYMYILYRLLYICIYCIDISIQAQGSLRSDLSLTSAFLALVL